MTEALYRNLKSREKAVLAEMEKDSVTAGLVSIPIVVFFPRLTLIYPPHFEDVQCQSGVNYIYKG